MDPDRVALPSVEGLAQDPGPRPDLRIGRMAAGLTGSEILKVAAEIRALVAAGHTVCNLTVGDFDPRLFPIPDALAEAVRDALAHGQTNYPPADGVRDLREAVRRFYERELGLDYPLSSVVIAGGARPVIYCTYLTVCDPGDRVVYPVPSWNNNHYAYLVGAQGVPVACRAEDRFLPTREALAGVLAGARLLCLNSPLNPAGTAFGREALSGICEEVLAENARRERRGERPLYLLYDHIYWMLCFGSIEHLTPPGLFPEMTRYTVFVDGISKSFASTGLRVGWVVAPADVIGPFSNVLGHIGAWAPRAEQVATAALLDDADAIRRYHARFKPAVEGRLDQLHSGFQQMKAEGLPVDSIPPMGAIYLTARIHPFGRRTRDGEVLATNEGVRRFLLAESGVAVVPFQAFGSREEDGWFRLSVGAASPEQIAEALPRLAQALRALA